MSVDSSQIDKLFDTVDVHSVSVNKYENSFNTKFFQSGVRITNEENNIKQQAVAEMESYIQEKY